jgi:hypothetical protein
MLKFDPDDPDDDEPNGAPPKITVKLGGDEVRQSEPSDGGADRGVPDRSRQNAQHEEQKVKEAICYSACGSSHPKSCSEGSCLLGLLCLHFQRKDMFWFIAVFNKVCLEHCWRLLYLPE